ncbi:MAG TPA: hypothetical protein VGQ16_18425 [Vicinamibacterales bacterium]|nr:hypothetical protein [Vicinamibacterales bacterium]
MILLIGAALLLRSFVALRHVRPGFDGHNVLTMQTPLIGRRFARAAPRRIIGIVGDVRRYQLRSEPRAAVYVPLRQLPDRQAAFLNRIGTSMT